MWGAAPITVYATPNRTPRSYTVLRRDPRTGRLRRVLVRPPAHPALRRPPVRVPPQPRPQEQRQVEQLAGLVPGGSVVVQGAEAVAGALGLDFGPRMLADDTDPATLDPMTRDTFLRLRSQAAAAGSEAAIANIARYPWPPVPAQPATGLAAIIAAGLSGAVDFVRTRSGAQREL